MTGGLALWLPATAALGQDAVVCINCDTETGAIARAAKEIAQWVKQIADMEKQLAEQVKIFEAMSGITDMMALAAQLNELTYQNPMQQFGDVIGMVQGNDASGSSLSGAIQTLKAQNNLYVPTPNGGSMPLLYEIELVMGQRSNSTAGVQAIASELLHRSHTILQGLLTLQQDIDTMANVHHMTAIGARVGSYQGTIASQAYQLQQVQAYAAAQQRAFDERERQAIFCSSVSWASHTQSLSGNTVNTTGVTGSCTAATN